MTEQKNTFRLRVSQPVCAALSGVNMDGRTSGNGHEKCLRVGGGMGVGGLPCRKPAAVEKNVHFREKKKKRKQVQF